MTEKTLSEEMYFVDSEGKGILDSEKVKKAIKRLKEELVSIGLLLMSNDSSDWDIALAKVRKLSLKDDKIFGEKLK